jgi:very-short-patch-repair endonuclease
MGDLRALLLDDLAMSVWEREWGCRQMILLEAGEWAPAQRWLDTWMGSKEARHVCSEWVASRLKMTPRAVLEVSPCLRAELARKCIEHESGDCACLAAEALGWIAATQWTPRKRLPAFARLAVEHGLPAWVIDARTDLRAGLEQGDFLAGLGFPVGLLARPEAWREFAESDCWERFATRWRQAPFAGQELPSQEARRFVRDTQPAAMALLEQASALILEEQAGAAGQVAGAARSAAEAFLFSMLDARALTRGRFALNVPLSFGFGLRAAEADLAAADVRLAIELDGYYHFRDADAYRRDRRKDALLQEHGWFVLRFLAVDAVRDPGALITRIEETLARRDFARGSAREGAGL